MVQCHKQGEIMNINEIIMPIIGASLTAVLSYIGLRLKNAYERFVETREKQITIEHTVKYVEQVYGDLEGCEKLAKAKITAKEWLEAKGIEISDIELTIFIESAVNAL